jgi:hypothetical protein
MLHGLLGSNLTNPVFPEALVLSSVHLRPSLRFRVPKSLAFLQGDLSWTTCWQVHLDAALMA